MRKIKSDAHDDGNQAFDKLAEGIRPLAEVITELRARMKAAGPFPNDRELLDCPKCKLEEDVTIEGMLITCRSDSPGVDTNLRFQPLDDREDWWVCPACGVEFRGEGISE